MNLCHDIDRYSLGLGRSHSRTKIRLHSALSLLGQGLDQERAPDRDQVGGSGSGSGLGSGWESGLDSDLGSGSGLDLKSALIPCCALGKRYTLEGTLLVRKRRPDIAADFLDIP